MSAADRLKNPPYYPPPPVRDPREEEALREISGIANRALGHEEIITHELDAKTAWVTGGILLAILGMGVLVLWEFHFLEFNFFTPHSLGHLLPY